MRRFFCGALSVLLFAPFAAAAVPAQSAGLAHVDASSLNSLSWRLIGPFRGGRSLAVTGVPGEPEHFYFGAVDGGVWESTNAGRTWNPIFDEVPDASIGAIAVAPSNTKTIYVGTGEADMRSDIAYGHGMYKSTDGGKTWSHIGLEDTRQIGRIVVDPHDANVVYVAALGHQYGSNAERGVFKSSDGGTTWQKVLFKDENTGAIDLALDPQHSETIFASLWQTRRPPWNTYPPSNGPGSGLYKSTDAGKTWTQLTNGLPKLVGHIGITVSPANPSRIYAQVDTGKDIDHGGVYRSDDGGATWMHMAGGKAQLRIWQRGWYFGGITADPKNQDVVYVMNTATYRSDDGGKTFNAIKGSPGGDDYHALWIYPDDANRMVLSSDQGTVVSVDHAKTWSSWYNQPTAQFYHVITDNRFPYWVYGAQQDSGAIASPSQTFHTGITMQDWRPMDAGGESGYVAPNPLQPAKIFGGSDAVTYEDLDVGQEQVIDPTLKYPDVLWRHTWTLPVVVSQADKHALYASRQQIFRSRDAGQSWSIVSPDLTRTGDINHPKNLDAATIADNSGLSRRGVVYAIAPSPLDAKLVWAGTDDGYVWITRDGGAHWSNITPHELTPWSKVGIIEASHFNRARAYLVIDRHRLDDYAPYIYRTTDGGATWSSIANGIPSGAFVNVVREDPKLPGLLYAGTERGMYVSFDDGAHWQSLQRNLPMTSIRDIDVHGNDLVIGTHGRAFWIMDNVTPLRQMRQAENSGTYLFAPQATIRFRRVGGFGEGVFDEGTPIQLEEPRGQNPPVGVILDYRLSGAASTPVVLEISDANGHVVRRYSSADGPRQRDPQNVDIAPWWIQQETVPSVDPGAHRFVWDFSSKNSNGPLVPPGTYTVHMRVNGKTYTQRATIVRDPRLDTTVADLQAQYAMANAIEDRLATIKNAQERVKTLSLTPAQRDELLGAARVPNPDDSVGTPPQDFYALRYLANAYNNLEGAVESADATPTPDMRAAFAKLNAMLDRTLVKMKSFH